MNLIIKINDLLIKEFGLPDIKINNAAPSDMLIATVLSQNTNDKNSYIAYQNLKNTFLSWKDAARADKKEIEELIKVAGLKKQKAETIKSILSNLIMDENYLSFECLNRMSNDDIFNMLLKIKGVGVKTTSCLLLFSLNRNVCPVDTHVHRTLNRIGIIQTTSPDKTFEIINSNFPKDIAYSFHTNLIKLGRAVCKPSNPLCVECPVKRICKYENKNKENRSRNIKNNGFLLLDNV